MFGYPDPKFRKGIGLMLTGIWITPLGFLLALFVLVFGVLMALFAAVVVMFGGGVLALAYDILMTVPPTPPAGQ